MRLMKALLLTAVMTTVPVAPAPTTIAIKRYPDARALCTLCGLIPGRIGCTVVPAFENGRPIGLKLLGVSRQPAAQARGLEEGDVLMRINGFWLNTPESRPEAFGSITRCADVRFTIRRKGRIIEVLPSTSASAH